MYWERKKSLMSLFDIYLINMYSPYFTILIFKIKVKGIPKGRNSKSLAKLNQKTNRRFRCNNKGLYSYLKTIIGKQTFIAIQNNK